MDAKIAELGFVRIFVQISFVYTATQRKLAIGPKKSSNQYSALRHCKDLSQYLWISAAS